MTAGSVIRIGLLSSFFAVAACSSVSGDNATAEDLSLVSIPANGFCNGHLPDPAFTPGKICTSSDPDFDGNVYPEHIAHCARNLPSSEKSAVAARYGIPSSQFSKYEFDHYIPLESGGSNDISNIWPQPIVEAREKDGLELSVGAAVKAGTLTQAAAIAKLMAWRPASGTGSGCGLDGGVHDSGTHDAAKDAADPDAGGGGRIHTIFLIVMENHNWSTIKGSASAPYINKTLLPMGAHAENYVNVPGIHPSEPNYLWLEAGTDFGIKNDSLPATNHQSSTHHLVNQLEAAGISWKTYAEGVSGNACPVTDAGLYAPKHTPFVFFDDVINDHARCMSHVRPYTELASDVASGAVARYNFITPDLCDDMHNSAGCTTTDAVANGDTWLSHEVPKILASSAYKQGGLVLITWDESEQGDHPIGLIALSPFAKPAYSNTLAYSHSSTLRTVQTFFGVGPLLGDAANANDLSDLFSAP